MRKQIALIMLLVFLALPALLFAQTQPPRVGAALPDLKIQKPADSAGLKYLGLSGSGTFAVDQVRAQALIIQIFSLYCPYCQKDAPNMNRFFGLIEGNPRLRGKIKILGIGAGNTQFEVNTFKKKYKVEFALVPDGDFKIHKIIGEVRTPYFIIVKLDGPKKREVVYSRLGVREDVEAFLAETVRLTGIQ